ncbi:MAG: hypothetical protein UH963_09490 [Agathobacter sp.]|nr:hypothetical protein [Agathobacter sp.]
MKFYKENLLEIVNTNNVNQLDFKDWIMFSTDCEDNLKKWIRFKTCDYPDPDVVLKQGAPKCVAVKLNWYSDKETIDNYYIDCIFSFATFFKAFLRCYAGEYMPYMGQVYENYEKIFSDKYKDEFCKKQDINRACLDELLRQLNLFAKNTHTLGNYMKCPDGEYNAVKGNYFKYKDRLELLYQDVKGSSKEVSHWSSWFDKNKKELKIEEVLENEELLKFEFNGNKMKNKHFETYTKYIKNINEIIETRGIAFAKKLIETS